MHRLMETITHRRGVAQSGSASGLGLEGRRFESYHPDHFDHPFHSKRYPYS